MWIIKILFFFSETKFDLIFPTQNMCIWRTVFKQCNEISGHITFKETLCFSQNISCLNYLPIWVSLWCCDPIAGRGFPHKGLWDNTQTNYNRYDSSGLVISPTQRPLLKKTHRRDKNTCPRAGFEPTTPASELPQTHGLDHAATGIGVQKC